MLHAIDLHEHLNEEKGFAIITMLAFQSSAVWGTELDTPEANRLAADSDAALCSEWLARWACGFSPGRALQSAGQIQARAAAAAGRSHPP